MADHDEIVLRDERASVPGTLSQQETSNRIRQRLDEDQLRLRRAVRGLQEAARELTPAARIRHDPYPWVFGGFAVGLVLGWLTAPPPR